MLLMVVWPAFIGFLCGYYRKIINNISGKQIIFEQNKEKIFKTKSKSLNMDLGCATLPSEALGIKTNGCIGGI